MPHLVLLFVVVAVDELEPALPWDEIRFLMRGGAQHKLCVSAHHVAPAVVACFVAWASTYLYLYFGNRLICACVAPSILSVGVSSSSSNNLS